MANVWVVTGGIGSGKSTIRRTLDDLGAVTIDADQIGHGVLEPDGPAFEAVADRWPSVVRDGRIVRPELGAIVFSNPSELRDLEAITHPAIGREIAKSVAAAGDSVVIVEVSVPKDLVGVGWLHTVVADLPVEQRRQRLIERGMDPAEVGQRMSAQPSRDEWRARGRWVISTAGTREEVAERVQRLWDDVILDSR